MNVIEIKNLKKKYQHQQVLDIKRYDFEKGRSFLLVGENGCGKSTLIKIILSLVKEDTGEIKNIINDIGYIPEKAIFPEFLNAFQFLEIICELRKINNSKQRIINLLEEWQLDGKKRIHKFSKGMLQKLLIIQALVHNPRVYIFDEPLNGLDKDMQKLFIKSIKYLRLHKKTIIIATHYRKYYKGLYDKIIYFENGDLYEKSF